MNVPPIVHQNLSDKIYDLLKEMIVRWEFRPGQRLIDSELALRYGVSRSLIRNAMTRATDGLIEVSRRRFYVARFFSEGHPRHLRLRIFWRARLPAPIAHTTDGELAHGS